MNLGASDPCLKSEARCHAPEVVDIATQTGFLTEEPRLALNMVVQGPAPVPGAVLGLTRPVHGEERTSFMMLSVESSVTILGTSGRADPKSMAVLNLCVHVWPLPPAQAD